VSLLFHHLKSAINNAFRGALFAANHHLINEALERTAVILGVRWYVSSVGPASSRHG
jgi:hypothetical protein